MISALLVLSRMAGVASRLVGRKTDSCWMALKLVRLALMLVVKVL